MFAPLLLLVGCATPNQKAAEVSLKSAHIDTSHMGSIRGRVVFSGAVPKPKKLDLSSNPTCERQHSGPVYTEDAIVGKNGGLANTLVRIKSGLQLASWVGPQTTQVLDQVGCIYTPHVIALQVNEPLLIANSDSLNHNVHAESSLNAPFNVLDPPRAEKIVRRFDHEELMIPITCGVHSWMRAYVSVIGNPYYALTDKDGAFELRSVPPGNYEIEAVHERFGRQTKAIQLAASASRSVDFAYTANGPQ